MNAFGWVLTVGAVGACGALALASGATRLGRAQQVLDGRTPLDVDIGHANPNLVDWDGDGRRDLLVGQFGGGKVRLYRNLGTDAAPRFRGFSYVQAAGADATVPVL